MLRFAPSQLTDAELELQAEVREFLAARAAARERSLPDSGMGAPRDQAFSGQARRPRLAWDGAAASGTGATSAAPLTVSSSSRSCCAGAPPSGYHWVADRQTGPMINRFGSEEQKQRFLPAICRGELSFAIGMSEPEAGSDLAAVRRAPRGWTAAGS